MDSRSGLSRLGPSFGRISPEEACDAMERPADSLLLARIGLYVVIYSLMLESELVKQSASMRSRSPSSGERRGEIGEISQCPRK